MKRFKVIVLSASGAVKYTYSGLFWGIGDAVAHYEMNGGRVIEIKELGVKLRPIRLKREYMEGR